MSRSEAHVARGADPAEAAGFGDSPDDAVKWNREALSMLAANDETPLLADVLRWQGSVLHDRGRPSEAEPLYHRSLHVAMRLGYDAGAAHALNCFGSLALRRGDLPAGANLMTEALVAANRCGDRRLVGMLQQNLGMVADIRGNSAAALAHYNVSLRAFESAGDLQPMSWVLNNLAVLHLKEERYSDADDVLRRAREIARAGGDLMTEGVIDENRAELQLLRGAIDEAYVPLLRAYEIADQRGDDVRRAAALKLRGAYQRLAGRPADAVETLRYALTLSAVGEDALLGAEVLYQFGLALYDNGQKKSNVWLRGSG
jgi:tetratricopeptide (TPR) repeat protein